MLFLSKKYYFKMHVSLMNIQYFNKSIEILFHDIIFQNSIGGSFVFFIFF